MNCLSMNCSFDGAPRQVVLSPHVYGPSVNNQAYFSSPHFPANMPAIWDMQWGHLPKDAALPAAAQASASDAAAESPPIILGEWGGASLLSDNHLMTIRLPRLPSLPAPDSPVYRFHALPCSSMAFP